jgi:putative two-component system response regulator
MIHYQQELEAEVQKKTSQLQSAFESIKKASLESIHLLASAMEYRDNETGAHNQRMSRYSEAVARKIGFCEEATVRLLYASPMHDVGKIGIPDRILFKPARLDSEEMDIMKRHTTIGAEILKNSDIDYIQLAEIIALNHHEKWDGTGYPEGLAGEEIPLSGRIVALADVFDALISKRPYKDPIPLDRSFEIIREGRGTHFDPALTDAFLDIHDDILAIIRRF